ncbi:hypothetical protein BSL82_00520 [Tardibacter chloracetimidivorans]|uniref:Uncharacterized protein n=1 Tax=Tardibacter chloracetimidivorans TaxID=1921510 RepID=A0A1L3ZQR9_9SPHN|nr:hypothetical protein BSL82_00520 [Tardibacter chloracetimidivorans]
MVAEDLIALAEDAYSDACDPDADAAIEDAYCDADGVCDWACCERSGCVIDKYHRGLALQAQAIEAGTGETERLDPKGESAVPKECAPNLSPEDNN